MNVSMAVSSLIAAFISVGDVLAKTRQTSETTDKRQRKGQRSPKRDHSGAKRLSRSLTEAPRALQHEYLRGIKACGPAFDSGDADAQSALAVALVQVNSGLVDIISQFLNHPSPSLSHDKHHRRPSLDFKSLAAISETTRVEACHTLHSLRKRLPRCMNVLRPAIVPNPKHKAKGRTMPHEMQWVVKRARPRPHKKGQPHRHPDTKQKQKRKANTSNSTGSSTLVNSASTSPNHTLRPRNAPHSYPPGRLVNTPALSYQRPDTMYTIASDSTKLGEIPMHRRADMPNFAEMERLNALAGFCSHSGNANPKESETPGIKRRGFFARVFRRVPVAPTE